jgi:isoquinoline 1-oxidoreductase alpha subunit
VAGKAIRTIEGLAPAGRTHVLQRAWIAHQVPQCGYCQSGMLMAAAALLERNPKPSDADIDAAITNLCRCGTYPRVRAAIHAAAAELRGAKP